MHEATVSDAMYVDDCPVPVGYENVGIDLAEEIEEVHQTKINVQLKLINKSGQKESEYSVYQIPKKEGQMLTDYCLKIAIRDQKDYDRENGTELAEEQQGGGLSPK